MGVTGRERERGSWGWKERWIEGKKVEGKGGREGGPGARGGTHQDGKRVTLNLNPGIEGNDVRGKGGRGVHGGRRGTHQGRSRMMLLGAGTTLVQLFCHLWGALSATTGREGQGGEGEALTRAVGA